MLPAIVSGATLGLVSTMHCAAMCGPLSSAAASPANSHRLTRYQLGRLLSYTFLGAMSGHVGRSLQLVMPELVGAWVVATLTAAACLLTARSLYVAAPRGGDLVQLEIKKPNRQSMFALLIKLVPRDPFALGLLSALLPCGVLASAVLAAIATGDAWQGFWLMAAFAAVSGVAVWSASLVVQVAPRRFSLSVRRALALSLVVLAVLSVYRPIHAWASEQGADGTHPACHDVMR